MAGMVNSQNETAPILEQGRDKLGSAAPMGSLRENLQDYLVAKGADLQRFRSCSIPSVSRLPGLDNLCRVSLGCLVGQ